LKWRAAGTKKRGAGKHRELNSLFENYSMACQSDKALAAKFLLTNKVGEEAWEEIGPGIGDPSNYKSDSSGDWKSAIISQSLPDGLLTFGDGGRRDVDFLQQMSRKALKMAAARDTPPPRFLSAASSCGTTPNCRAARR